MSQVAVAGAAVSLMVVGLVAVGYGVYLEMIHAVALWWWDRPILLAPLGLAAILTGLLLIV